jgi:hypothetical protein
MNENILKKSLILIFNSYNIFLLDEYRNGLKRTQTLDTIYE